MKTDCFFVCFSMTYPPAKGNRARTPTWLPGVNLPDLRRGPEDLPEVRAGQALFKTVKERGSTDPGGKGIEKWRSWSALFLLPHWVGINKCHVPAPAKS